MLEMIPKSDDHSEVPENGELLAMAMAMEKTVWAMTTIIFLSLLLDLVWKTVSIPVENLRTARSLLQHFLCKKKITVQQLQQLCGFLNFLYYCVIPGRAFLTRLYAMTSPKNIGTRTYKIKYSKLKPHYHICITQQMKMDMLTWNRFLKHRSAICRPFLDFTKKWEVDELFFYRDASKNLKFGIGGICQNPWMIRASDRQFFENCQLGSSIEYLELFTVTATVLAWIKRFKNRKVVIFMDNKSSMHMVNNTSSKCIQNCMRLLALGNDGTECKDYSKICELKRQWNC